MDEAERVPGRVGVDVVATVESVGAEREYAGFGLVKVVDHDIEVDLLRAVRIGPSGWLVIDGELEGEPGRGVVLRDDDSVGGAERHRQAEQLRVEVGQAGWVWAVDYDMVTASNHDGMLAQLR